MWRNRESRTVEYHAWNAMMRRCYFLTCQNYKHYGERGITVDVSWHSYETFLKDMGRRPTEKHSLHRIDNDGNYCKENCKWGTVKEQYSNKRSNGKISTLTDEDIFQIKKDYSSGLYTQNKLASLFGISRKHIHRIVYDKWILKQPKQEIVYTGKDLF